MCTDKSPKAFVLSAGIQKLPITWLSVDNYDDKVLCYKPTSINHNIHGCFLCRYRVTGWFWWISGLRAVAMWSSSSFTKIYVFAWSSDKNRADIWNEWAILIFQCTFYWPRNVYLSRAHKHLRPVVFNNKSCGTNLFSSIPIVIRGTQANMHSCRWCGWMDGWMTGWVDGLLPS